MIRFSRSGDRIALDIDDRSAQVLGGLVRQLAELVRDREQDAQAGFATPSDPALARLLPDPVHDDPLESAEVRSLTEPGLIAHKLDNARAVGATLIHPGTFEPGDETAWLQTLTDLRLVLAARLGIERDGDDGRAETEDDLTMQSAYHWLGTAQSDLLDVIDGSR